MPPPLPRICNPQRRWKPTPGDQNRDNDPASRALRLCRKCDKTTGIAYAVVREPNKQISNKTKYQTKKKQQTNIKQKVPKNIRFHESPTKMAQTNKTLKWCWPLQWGKRRHAAPELGAPLASRTWGPFLFLAVRLTHRLIGAPLARGISRTRLGLVAPASLYRAQGRGHTVAIKCQARSRSSSLAYVGGCDETAWNDSSQRRRILAGRVRPCVVSERRL